MLSKKKKNQGKKNKLQEHSNLQTKQCNMSYLILVSTFSGFAKTWGGCGCSTQKLVNMKVGRSVALLVLILIILLKSDSHDYVEIYAEASFNESPA